MPGQRPVTRVRLVRDTADGGPVERELEPVVASAGKACVLELPVEADDGAGDPHYLLDWRVLRDPDRREKRGDSQLVTRVQLLSGEQCLDTATLVIDWYDPANRDDGEVLLRRQAEAGLPVPEAAEAFRAMLAATSEPVPVNCGYCVDTWELVLLTAVNRVWPLVRQHGDDRARHVLAHWSLDPRTYVLTNHCNCHRDPCCGAARTPGTPHDQVRAELLRARARHSELL
jgi:hypothetical protein